MRETGETSKLILQKPKITMVRDEDKHALGITYIALGHCPMASHVGQAKFGLDLPHSTAHGPCNELSMRPFLGTSIEHQ